MSMYWASHFSGGKEESHSLLAEAISEYTGDVERAGALMEGMYAGKNGKPYIDGFDFFSISHTENVWAVVFCERECGLDIQLPRKCRALSIAEKFFHPDDAAAVAYAAAEDPQKGNDMFFRLWARREALVKAAGGSVGNRDLPPVTGDRAVYRGVTYSIHDVDMPGMPEIYAAVCAEGDEVPGHEISRLDQVNGRSGDGNKEEERKRKNSF